MKGINNDRYYTQFPKSTYTFSLLKTYVNKAVYHHILCMVLAIILLLDIELMQMYHDFSWKAVTKAVYPSALRTVFPGFLMQQDLLNVY